MDLFYILLTLLLLTRLCGEIAERLGQAALVGELVCGMLLGALTAFYGSSFPLLANLPDNEVFHGLTELGIFFLMLLAGLEMRPKEVVEASIPAFLVSLGGFVLPVCLGLGVGYVLLPDSPLYATQLLFIAVALSITAVPIAVKVLLDLNRLKSAAGQTIVSAAVFDDVISLLLLAVLTAMMNSASMPGLGEVLVIAGNITLFFLLSVPIALFFVPWLATCLQQFKIQELEFSFLLISGLGFALLAEHLGLHFIIGAFLAGLFYQRNTFDSESFATVKDQVSGITSGFLAPIFFVSIGFHLNFTAFAQAPSLIAILIIAAIAGKMLGCWVPARLSGFTPRGSMFIGAGMTARGAVELIIADIALQKGVFAVPAADPVVSNLFSAVVVMTLFTTIAAPILMASLAGEERDELERVSPPVWA